MSSPCPVMQRSLARLKCDAAPLRCHTLRPPGSKSVCMHTQVFAKNCVNSSLNASTKRAPLGALFHSRMQQSLQILAKQLALRELERLARLGAAVLLALDGTAVAGQETTLLQHAAQIRFEIGQRLGDAMTDGTGLARQTTTGDGADHVVLTGTGGCDQRLLDHHPQHRTCEIDFDFTGVDDDLAGPRLDPDAGDRVLALAGGIGTNIFVDLLDIFRGFRRRRLELRQLIERLHGIGHLMRPSCSCGSSKQRPGFRAAGLRADAPALGKRADYRVARGPAVHAESCARWPSRLRARENGPRESTWPYVP